MAPGFRGNSTNSTAFAEEVRKPDQGMAVVGMLGLVCAAFVLVQRRQDCTFPQVLMGQEARRPKSKPVTQVELDGPFYGTYDIHDDTASILANEGGPRAGSYAPPSM